MPDFSFVIDGDASKALAEEQKVIGGLDDIRSKAAAASSAVNASFDQTAAKLNEIGASAAAVALKMRDALGGGSNASASMQVLARKAAADLNDQLKRQQQILDEMHAPMENHRKDLQALQALYRQDKISAEEYEAQLEKLNAELARSKAPAGSNDNISGGLSTVGHVAAMAGIGLGAHELLSLSDSYTEAGNKIRVVTESQGEFNSVMNKTFEIAQQTRTGWDELTGTVQRITNSTRELGLTQAQVLNLTREMSQGVRISGASSQEAAMALGELNHAFELGTLQGREFKVLMKDANPLMHELQVASGVTASQFAEMGKHGQISAQMLIDWFGKADKDIQEKFSRLTPTMHEGFTMLKNEASRAAGDVVSATHAGEAFGVALKTVGDTVSAVGGFFKLLHEAIGDTGTGVVAAVGGAVLAFKTLGATMTTVFGAIELGTYLGKKLADVWNEELVAQTKRNEAIAAANETYSIEIKKVSEEADAIHKSMQEQRLQNDELSEAVKHAGDLTEAFDLMSQQGEIWQKQIEAGQAVLAKENKALNDAAQKVLDYGAAVAVLRAQMSALQALGMSDPMKALTSGDVATVRGYVDAQRQAYDLAGRYGVIVDQIHAKEVTRQRGIEDLKGALAAGDITQAEYNEAIKQFIPHADAAARKAAELAREYEKLARALLGGDSTSDKAIKAGERERALIAAEEAYVVEINTKAKPAIESYTAALEQLDEMYSRAAHGGIDEFAYQLERTRIQMEQARTLYEQNPAIGNIGGAIGDAVGSIFGSGEHAYSVVTKMQDGFVTSSEKAAKRFDDAWSRAAGNATASLLQMEIEGKQSTGEMVETIVRQLALVAVQQAALRMGGTSGAFLGGFAQVFGSIPGHATGAQFYMGGVGGQDSQLLVRRVSPDERVTIETPQDVRTGKYFGGGRGPTSVHVHLQNDRRDLVEGMDSYDGARVLARVDRRMGRRRRS